jgi:hypothetical protein
MPDRRIVARLALVIALCLGALSVPAATLAAVPVPERCADGSTPPAGGVHDCPENLNLGGLVGPIIAVAVGVGVILLIVAFLLLRRQSKAPLAPADPGEWWMCPKCGSTNVIGSARCYSCGTWQR